jgi:hypothetical protein
VKASRWEILGAWLRIWTPPRDVEIPPVPRRALAVVLALVAAAIVVWLTLIAPAIDDAKRRDAGREALVAARAARAERARLTLDQRPGTGRAAAAARLYAAGRAARARAALLAAVRAGVARDARARVASGTFDRPVREVQCHYVGGPGGSRVRPSCFATTSRTAAAAVGQPFVAAGSLRDGRYAWCHENPGPGEGAAGVAIAVPLARACTGR